MAKLQDGSGTLSLSQYYEDGGNKPRHYGKIKLTPALIDKIVANGYVVPISGWDKDGEYGPFVSIAVDVWSLDKQKDAQQEPITAPDVPDNDAPF